MLPGRDWYRAETTERCGAAATHVVPSGRHLVKVCGLHAAEVRKSQPHWAVGRLAESLRPRAA